VADEGNQGSRRQSWQLPPSVKCMPLVAAVEAGTKRIGIVVNAAVIMGDTTSTGKERTVRDQEAGVICGTVTVPGHQKEGMIDDVTAAVIIGTDQRDSCHLIMKGLDLHVKGVFIKTIPETKI
jgi:hypothetical protein